jgi:hypothetical protein
VCCKAAGSGQWAPMVRYSVIVLSLKKGASERALFDPFEFVFFPVHAPGLLSFFLPSPASGRRVMRLITKVPCRYRVGGAIKSQARKSLAAATAVGTRLAKVDGRTAKKDDSSL